MLYAPVYGTCKKLISSTRLLGLSATLKLYLERSMINLSSATSKFQIENIGETLFKKLRRKLGLIERKCQIREEGLCGTFDNKSIPELFAIRIRYTTSEYCQEDFIIDRIQWLLNNTIKVQFDKEFFSMSAVAFSPLEYFDYCTNARDHYNVGKLLLLEYIDFQRFSRCPSVLLNVDHYTNLMKKASETSQRREINSLFNLTTLGSNVTLGKENLTVHVCFESYSSVLWKANHGMSYFCMKTMLVVMSLLSSVFNIFIPRICNILQSL